MTVLGNKASEEVTEVGLGHMGGALVGPLSVYEGEETHPERRMCEDMQGGSSAHPRARAHQEPILTNPWSFTSSLQSCEN